MLSAESNELLTRVTNDASMGRFMRRHWIPICLLEEVTERDGVPRHIRVLGEDLVAFRDTNGRLGVLDDACPHRRVSLALGRNEECGLRCLFHGWKIDVEGNIVDMPSENLEPGAKPRMKHRSYPVQESGGLVWIYMGDVASVPKFAPPPWAKSDGTHVVIAKYVVHANWAQATEGGLDSAHSGSLHSSYVRGAKVDRAQPGLDGRGAIRPSVDKAPRLEVQLTSYGLRYAAIRKPIENADTTDYVRVTAFIAPFTVLIPPNAHHAAAQMAIPIDDENTTFYFLAFGPNEIDREQYLQSHGAQVGVHLDANYRMLQGRDANYGQNRDIMKRGHFSGIHGVPPQDIAMWETMGPIADRTREVLGKSDMAVAQFRNLMVEFARIEHEGRPGRMVNFSSNFVTTNVQAFEGLVSKSIDWRTLTVNEDERATFFDRSKQSAAN